jgi:pantothenate kinase
VSPLSSPSFRELVERAAALGTTGQRRMQGVTRAPGAGKSTLAEALLAQPPPLTAYVPMDGFHLANCKLLRPGRGDRKGAPDTFDGEG